MYEVYIGAVLATLLGALCYGVRAASFGYRRSHDGRCYVTPGPRPIPFHYRWLIPRLCGSSIMRWRIVSAVSLIGSAGLVGLILGQCGQPIERQLFGAALFCGLGGMFHVNTVLPMLIDAPAFFLCLGAVSADVGGHTALALLLAVLGATVKETVPIFAALATLNPVLLLGLIAVLLRALLFKSNGRAPWGWDKQRFKIHDPLITVLPWGVCLAALWNPSLEMLLSCAVAYGLLFWATDTTRIYQWAALPMIVSAAVIVPETWLLPLGVAHLASPFVGDIR